MDIPKVRTILEQDVRAGNDYLWGAYYMVCKVNKYSLTIARCIDINDENPYTDGNAFNVVLNFKTMRYEYKNKGKVVAFKIYEKN